MGCEHGFLRATSGRTECMPFQAPRTDFDLQHLNSELCSALIIIQCDSVELCLGACQISSLYNHGRTLFQLFVGGSARCFGRQRSGRDPGKIDPPVYGEARAAPDRFNLLITSHRDLDHEGGNTTIHQNSRHASLAGGEADRHLVEDPKCLYSDRYNFCRTNTA